MGMRHAAIAALALLCAASPAQALNTTGPNGPLSFQKQVSPNQIGFSLEGVPDIDQARGTNPGGTKVGLPNNGSYYCVPTTGMDFLAYLADRGFAGSLGVPSKDWTAANNFNQMSVLLAQLGGEMGTDPFGGTSGNGFIKAMTKRLADSETGAIQVYYYEIDSKGGEPTISDVINSGADGDLLAAGIGFYKDETEGDTTYKRPTGGHAFTIVGGAASSPAAKSGTVFTHDPATVFTADTTQGPYTTDQHNIAPFDGHFIYTDDNDVTKKWDATVGTWDGSETVLFTGFTRIVPKTTWVKFGKNLERIVPEQLVPDPGPLKTIYEVPGDGSVKALSLSAETNAPAFLVNGSSNVYSLDLLTGNSAKLGSVPGATALTYGGPSQRLYVAGKNKLVAFNRTGQVVGSHKLTSPVSSLSFDEANGRLAGLAKGRLVLFDSKLHTLGTRNLPAVQHGSGTPMLAFGPLGNLVVGRAGTGKVFVSKPNAVSARRLRAAGPKVTLNGRPLQGGGKIHGLAVDDKGQVIVSVGGKLRVFSAGGRRRAGSPFDGAAGDAVLAVSRSFDNSGDSPFQTALDRTVGPPPDVPGPAPDLVVHGAQGSNAVIVANQGDAAAGPFTVQVSDSGGAVQNVRFDTGLAAGAEAVLARQPCQAGRSYLADSAGEVAESDEGNNTYSCP